VADWGIYPNRLMPRLERQTNIREIDTVEHSVKKDAETTGDTLLVKRAAWVRFVENKYKISINGKRAEIDASLVRKRARENRAAWRHGDKIFYLKRADNRVKKSDKQLSSQAIGRARGRAAAPPTEILKKQARSFAILTKSLIIEKKFVMSSGRYLA